MQVRNVCLRYGLPHPLELLENPLPKIKFQKLVKQKIAEFWHRQLSAKIESLSSLVHFNSSYHSLLLPHPLWTTAGCNPHEVNKATILARMISGRYRTERLCRFWTDNRHGHCLAPGCDKVVGDLQHLLLDCPALEPARSNLIQMWLDKAASIPPLLQLVTRVLASPASTQMKFILDPISIPEIVQLCQALGWQALECLFYMIRTYAYGLHRKKLIIIGKWPYSTKNENCNVQSNLLSVSGSVKTACPVPTSTESPCPVHTGGCEALVTQCTVTQPVLVLQHPLPPSPHEQRADGLAGDQHGHSVRGVAQASANYPAVPDTGHEHHNTPLPGLTDVAPQSSLVCVTGQPNFTCVGMGHNNFRGCFEEQIFCNENNINTKAFDNDMNLPILGRGDSGGRPCHQRLTGHQPDPGLLDCSDDCPCTTCSSFGGAEGGTAEGSFHSPET